MTYRCGLAIICFYSSLSINNFYILNDNQTNLKLYNKNSPSKCLMGNINITLYYHRRREN